MEGSGHVDPVQSVTGGVVEDGDDVDGASAPPVDGIVQHLHRVLPDDPGAVERLGPVHQDPHVQCLLVHREGEAEPCKRCEKIPTCMQ